MALFGTSDEYVPLLTALYQVTPNLETPQGSELDVILTRYVSGLPHIMAYWSKRYEGKQDTDTPLRKVAGVQALMVRLMDAAADDVPPSDADLTQFNDLARDILTPPQLFRTGPVFMGMSWPPEKLGMERLTFFDEDFSDNHFKQIAVGKAGLVVRYPTPLSETASEAEATYFIGEALTEFIKAFERNMLTRCEECSSVFPATRRSQRFCSHRDAHRAGTRRRRAKEKSSTATL